MAGDIDDFERGPAAVRFEGKAIADAQTILSAVIDVHVLGGDVGDGEVGALLAAEVPGDGEAKSKCTEKRPHHSFPRGWQS